MKKRRNWLLVIVGVGVLLVFIGIGAIIAVTAWVSENLAVEETTEGNAVSEFEAVKATFTRPPIIEMRDGRPAYVGGKKPEPPPNPAPIDRLHVLAWDPDEQRLASFSIPFWLLRLKSGAISFSTYASGFDDNKVNLRPEDVERYGPGPVLEATMPDGERVLVWTK